MLERPDEDGEDGRIVEVDERIRVEVHEVGPALVEELDHGQDAALSIVAAIGRAQVEEGLPGEAREAVQEHSPEGDREQDARGGLGAASGESHLTGR